MNTKTNGVNHSRRHGGLNHKSVRALRVLIVTGQWLQNVPGVPTGACAAVIANVSRPTIDAARAILESDDKALIAKVITGDISLTAAAAKVRRRVRLIESFKAASAIDRAAFGHAVGAGELFDAAVVPSL